MRQGQYPVGNYLPAYFAKVVLTADVFQSIPQRSSVHWVHIVHQVH